ncbi:MAG: hypothetical protein RIS85_600 [Pseudomonadota bacterium]
MLSEHELRREIVAEMHLRRWPVVAPPCRIVQFVRVIDPDQRENELELLCGRLGPVRLGGAQLGHPRHRDGTLGPGIGITWERHSEASTLTLFINDTAPHNEVAKAIDWAGTMPGKVIRATRLIVLADEREAETALPKIGFASEDLVTCWLCPEDGERAARIWSDFTLRRDGFGLIVVAAGHMPAPTLSRTLQRLQELGNYRNLALLGLPVARSGWAALDRIESQLDAVNAALTQPDTTDDDLLAQVFDLWSALIAQVSASTYRMDATQAYAAIVEERLADLNIRACPGHLSLTDFTQRRFLPAVRTCAAHARRAEALVKRTGQVVALLRTRIETRIENQNGRLLASMESNASRQLRLQQLVEGLSVVAVSYYALGIVGKVVEGVGELVPGIHAHLWGAILAPLVLLGVWRVMHVQKRRILGH